MRRRASRRRPRFRTIGVVAKPTAAPARAALSEVLKTIHRHGVEPVLDHDAAALAGRQDGVHRTEVSRRSDAVVVLGGDGTFLSVARTVGPHGPPLVGINLGSLGFLTEVKRSALSIALDAVILGEASEEKRLMLEVTVHKSRGRAVTYTALNDVVVTKGALARLVPLRVCVDEEPVTTYRADGLIVASPTGSTAYSLSAGGPLVHPCMDAILITPICPHTLTNRPLIVPSRSIITVAHPVVSEEVHLTVDGQLGVPFGAEDRLEVRRSRIPLRVLRPFPRSFYETLRSKLKWG